MKNVLFSLLLAASLANAYAQCVPNAPTGQPGFSPHPDSLPSIKRGQPFYTVIHMENFDTLNSNFGVAYITNIVVDSITGGPDGINFNLIPGDTIDGGATACLEIFGTTTDAPGQYILKAWTTFNYNSTLLGLQSFHGDITDIVNQMISGGVILTDTPVLPYYLVVDSFAGPAPRLVSGSPCGGGVVAIDANIAGSGNYSVSWTGTIPVDSPNAMITTVTIPPAGSYTFTVQAIDLFAGDTLVGSITFNASASPYAVDAGGDASIGCSGGHSALLQAAISTTNGAGSTYRWSNGMRGEFNRVVPGTYIVTATDAGSCLQATDTVIVFGNLNITLNGVHENCGSGDGTAHAQVAGGAGSNSYLWSNGGSTASVSNLAAGVYTLSVTDATGCIVTDSITLLDSCGVIQGMVFEDVNRNGVYDVAEMPMAGVAVSAGNGLTVCSNSNGHYEVIVPSYGAYTLSIDTPYRYYCFNSLYLPDAIITPVTGTSSVNISSGNSVAGGNNFGLADPQTTCGTVSGHVFEDLNGNGVEDLNEPPYSPLLLQVNPVGFAFTDMNGDYASDAPFDTPLHISVPGIFYWYLCNSSNSLNQTFPSSNQGHNTIVTQSAPASIGNDFGFSTASAASFDVGVYNVWPDFPQACSHFNVFMDWKVQGTVAADCYLMLDFPASAAFVTSVPLPDTVGTAFIGWHVPAGTTDRFECYMMEFFMDCSALPGASLTFTGHWDCTASDACSNNNQLSRTVNLIGTPKRGDRGEENFMAVYHQNGLEKLTIEHADSTFSYVIALRNITNDTAYNITVIDTLPPHFQLNTVSHPFSNLMSFDFKVSSGNVLIWQFNNVNLPPAKTNRQKSMGFIQFNVIMKSGLPAGTVFENRAAVIYNYSEPIITNKTVNVLGIVGVDEHEGATGNVQIMPNPNEGLFVVRASAAAKTNWQIEVYSLTATILFSQAAAAQQELNHTIDLSSFPRGMYLVKVSTGEIISVKKLAIH